MPTCRGGRVLVTAVNLIEWLRLDEEARTARKVGVHLVQQPATKYRAYMPLPVHPRARVVVVGGRANVTRIEMCSSQRWELERCLSRVLPNRQKRTSRGVLHPRHEWLEVIGGRYVSALLAASRGEGEG